MNWKIFFEIDKIFTRTSIVQDAWEKTCHTNCMLCNMFLKYGHILWIKLESLSNLLSLFFCSIFVLVSRLEG